MKNGKCQKNYQLVSVLENAKYDEKNFEFRFKTLRLHA